MLKRLSRDWLKRFNPQARSMARSARYISEQMAGAADLVERNRLLEFALVQCGPEGLLLEFGVYKGDSLALIAKRSNTAVHGFDSFEGLPEDWTGHQRKGRFSLSGQVPDIGLNNVVLHKGPFHETLPRFLASHAGPVRFLHVDCDLYSSTLTVLENLVPHLIPGSVLVFDEYLNYPDWDRHEFRAFQEIVASTKLAYEYLAYASNWYSVAIRIVGWRT